LETYEVFERKTHEVSDELWTRSIP